MDLFVRQRFSPPVDKAVVAADWHRRGYSCDWFSDPPGREWRDFVHGSNELVTVVEGRLELTVAGSTYRVELGDEVFIPRGAVHSVKSVQFSTATPNFPVAA